MNSKDVGFVLATGFSYCFKESSVAAEGDY